MRGRRLELRLSDREYDRLYALAASDPVCRMKSGRPSLSAYIRKRIIWSGSDPDDLQQEMRSLTYQVRKAGVNINQAVHRINIRRKRHRIRHRRTQLQRRHHPARSLLPPRPGITIIWPSGSGSRWPLQPDWQVQLFC